MTESRAFRFAVNVLPKTGILDPQGRAVEQGLPHLGIHEVRDVRVGRRVELTVEAADAASAEAVVRRLAEELLANPLIESYALEPLVDQAADGAEPTPAPAPGGGG